MRLHYFQHVIWCYGSDPAQFLCKVEKGDIAVAHVRLQCASAVFRMYTRGHQADFALDFGPCGLTLSRAVVRRMPDSSSLWKANRRNFPFCENEPNWQQVGHNRNVNSLEQVSWRQVPLSTHSLILHVLTDLRFHKHRHVILHTVRVEYGVLHNASLAFCNFLDNIVRFDVQASQVKEGTIGLIHCEQVRLRQTIILHDTLEVGESSCAVSPAHSWCASPGVQALLPTC